MLGATGRKKLMAALNKRSVGKKETTACLKRRVLNKIAKKSYFGTEKFCSRAVD